jgi:hypothetical protein
MRTLKKEYYNMNKKYEKKNTPLLKKTIIVRVDIDMYDKLKKLKYGVLIKDLIAEYFKKENIK